MEGWNRNIAELLDRSALTSLAENWPRSEHAAGFAHLCAALLWWDEHLPLDMAESFLPTMHSVLNRDPIDGLQELSDIAGPVLRVHDILGIYKGKLKPSPHQLKLARQ